MINEEQEIRFAQKDIMRGGNIVIQGGLHLYGTKFEKDYKRLYKALDSLNNKLIKEINKKSKKKK